MRGGIRGVARALQHAMTWRSGVGYWFEYVSVVLDRSGTLRHSRARKTELVYYTMVCIHMGGVSNDP
jgi:hypothetical protein